MRIGDYLLRLGMFVWMTVAVGPWWVGLGLYSAAMCLNILVNTILKRRK